MSRSRSTMKAIIGILVCLISAQWALSELLELKCDEIKAISYYDRYYGIKCTISDVSGDDSSTFIIRSANNFEYNKNIQEVELTRSKIYEIPREIFGTFVYLKRLQANACGLQDLHKSNFNYAASLQELRMRSNQIKKLPNSVFNSLQTLITLDLTGNEISEIEKNAFVGLESLEFLTLSDNKIVTLDEGLFRELHNLLSLRLDTNKLQIIEENLFASNKNLSDIRFDNNEIALINGDAFGRLGNLKYLNLGSNRLHSINIKDTKIERLWMPYNKIKSLHINSKLKLLHAQHNELEEIIFTGNSEIVELKLRQNFISNISVIQPMKKLEVLDISYNPLGSISISTFARMNDLLKLNLEFTNISAQSLTYGTFAHNSNLSTLDLSYNQLGNIDFNIFTSVNQLSQLKIDGNNLTEMPYENIKQLFPKLSLIGLTDNDWNCSYLSTMIKQLQVAKVMIFVAKNLRVYDEMNVDGIRCHNNKTQHVQWQNPVVHFDDNEVEAVENRNSRPSDELSDVGKNLTKLWDTLWLLQRRIESTFTVNHEALKSIEPRDSVTQLDFGSIKVVLWLMLTVMLILMLTWVIKYAKVFVPKKRFYYPSENLRRSTTTIQTDMEQVM